MVGEIWATDAATVVVKLNLGPRGFGVSCTGVVRGDPELGLGLARGPLLPHQRTGPACVVHGVHMPQPSNTTWARPKSDILMSRMGSKLPFAPWARSKKSRNQPLGRTPC